MAEYENEVAESIGRRWPRKTLAIAAIVVALVLVSGAAYWWLPKTLGECLPTEFAGSQMISMVEGDRAITATASSHQGPVTSVRDAVIAGYQGDLTIWISSYDTPENARIQLDRMTKAMRRFGKGFEQTEFTKLGSQRVVKTYPGGKPQYFWAYKRWLVYVVPGPLEETDVAHLAGTINGRLKLYRFVPGRL